VGSDVDVRYVHSNIEAVISSHVRCTVSFLVFLEVTSAIRTAGYFTYEAYLQTYMPLLFQTFFYSNCCEHEVKYSFSYSFTVMLSS